MRKGDPPEIELHGLDLERAGVSAEEMALAEMQCRLVEQEASGLSSISGLVIWNPELLTVPRQRLFRAVSRTRQECGLGSIEIHLDRELDESSGISLKVSGLVNQESSDEVLNRLCYTIMSVLVAGLGMRFSSNKEEEDI
jgi:hypothetical protein